MERERTLIGIDLDGTLLTPNKTITDNTRKILEKAIQKGHEIVPVTGRPYQAIPLEIWEIPIRYAITSNGATIWDRNENRIIQKQYIPKEEAQRIIEFLQKQKIKFELFIEGIGYETKETFAELKKRYEMTAYWKHFLQSRCIHQNLFKKIEEKQCGVEEFSVLCKNAQEAEKLKQYLRKYHNIQIFSSSDRDFEITDLHTDKGAAFLKLAAQLGIARKHTLAFGDGENDVTLLKSAAISIAMKNAKEEIKMKTDYVTESNEKDGVAVAMKRFLEHTS